MNPCLLAFDWINADWIMLQAPVYLLCFPQKAENASVRIGVNSTVIPEGNLNIQSVVRISSLFCVSGDHTKTNDTGGHVLSVLLLYLSCVCQSVRVSFVLCINGAR
jgi:hypothetical protein